MRHSDVGAFVLNTFSLRKYSKYIDMISEFGVEFQNLLVLF